MVEESLRQTFAGISARPGRCLTLAEAGVDFETGKNLIAEPSAEHTTNRVIKVSAISRGEFDGAESKPLPAGYAPPMHHRIQSGDILFGRASGSLELLGATVRVEEDPKHLFLPDKVWRAVLKSGSAIISREYLLAILQSSPFKSHLRHIASGAAGVRNVGKTRVLGYESNVPDAHDQQEFAARAEQLRHLRSQQLRQLAGMRRLFASLQHELLTPKS